MSKIAVARSSGSGTALAKPGKSERDLAFKEMNEILQEEALEIEVKFSEELTSIIKSRWNTGRQLMGIQDNPGKYGPQSIELLSAYLGINRDDLGTIITFGRRYTEDDVKHLLTARRKDGKALTWSHVESLCRIPDKKSRQQFEKQALSESLGYRELAERIASYLGGKNPLRSKNAGRPQKPPSSLRGFMEQIHARTLTYHTAIELWSDPDKGVVASFDKTPPDKVDKKLIAAALVAEEDLQDLEENLMSMRREVARVRVKLEQRCKANLDEKVANTRDDPEEPEDSQLVPVLPDGSDESE